ncbi:hypothetical protein Taro_022833 [Colocasia esculenta]|uniref:Uncharacterized protein n=1 Tax=Colocasia esculenta TaxID=4460 RepID=A0A843V924_COLES|nr:hypothetical protein [Colocasia esculenta]
MPINRPPRVICSGGAFRAVKPCQIHVSPPTHRDPLLRAIHAFLPQCSEPVSSPSSTYPGARRATSSSSSSSILSVPATPSYHPLGEVPPPLSPFSSLSSPLGPTVINEETPSTAAGHVRRGREDPHSPVQSPSAKKVAGVRRQRPGGGLRGQHPRKLNLVKAQLHRFTSATVDAF